MKARPIEKTIEGNRVLCRVPLSDGKRHAEIWAEDLEAIQALGISVNWAGLRNGYVTACGRRAVSGKVLVARVLMDAQEGEIVVYRDKNPLNLRRENLGLMPHGRAKITARDMISRDPGIVLWR